MLQYGCGALSNTSSTAVSNRFWKQVQRHNTKVSNTMSNINWIADLEESARLRAKSSEDAKTGRALLWRGAQAAVTEWREDLATNDVQGDVLYANTMDALGGKGRKGDASKIRTVALAVKNHGLVMGQFKSLSAAYKAAYDLTRGAAVNADEDAVADATTQNLAADVANVVPTTPEDAAKVVLSLGVNAAASILLDALGSANHKAHRSFLRSVLDEVSKRAPEAAKPKGKTGPAQPKDGAALPSEVGVKPKADASKVKAKPKPKAATADAPKVKAPPAVPVKTKVKPPAAGVKPKAEAPDTGAKPKPKGRVIRKPKAKATA